MTDPHADGTDGHQCFCVVVWWTGRVSACRAHVESNDQPFCDRCTARHPNVHSGVVVRTRPLARGLIPSPRKAPL